MRDKQPFGFAFIDFEGSRAGSAPPMRYWSWPHIHAVMLAHPDVNQVFAETFISEAKRNPRYGSAEIAKFDPERESLINVLTYCSKGYFKISQSENSGKECFQAFPMEKPAGASNH